MEGRKQRYIRREVQVNVILEMCGSEIEKKIISKLSISRRFWRFEEGEDVK